MDEAFPELDDLLDTIGRQEGITEDGVGLLADAVHPAGALDEADDRPREIIIDHSRRVLEVLPFG